MNKTRRMGLSLCLAFAITALLGGTADAAGSVRVTGGTLAITAPAVANFGDVTLNGETQTTTAPVGAFSVTDARGTGRGWKVTVRATRLRSGSKTLPLQSISCPAPLVTKRDGTSNVPPAILSGPYLIDTNKAVKIASAARGTGMGSYLFSLDDMVLTVPANAYAGTYTTTVTFTVATGP